mmetsp:Transcript_28005/g.99574  ORF Transcript_28005/g.99574 Transcript_28005/m.99574 type:complete len:348 (-) Transcript_28005:147-1190(-)
MRVPLGRRVKSAIVGSPAAAAPPVGFSSLIGELERRSSTDTARAPTGVKPHGGVKPRLLGALLAAGCWEAQYDRLADYTALHGDCLVPTRFVAADGTRLGQWVNVQRKAQKAGKLSPSRFDRLEAIGFVWAVLAGGWEANFEALQTYIKTHGNAGVPDSYVTNDGIKLGQWTREQRKVHTAGEMSPGRAERLEAVSFAWRVLADGWDANFEALKKYHEAHATSVVPRSFVAFDGTKLGQWVTTQRQARKAGEMSTDRVERLDKVGFVWRVERPVPEAKEASSEAAALGPPGKEAPCEAAAAAAAALPPPLAPARAAPPTAAAAPPAAATVPLGAADVALPRTGMSDV